MTRHNLFDLVQIGLGFDDVFFHPKLFTFSDGGFFVSIGNDDDWNGRFLFPQFFEDFESGNTRHRKVEQNQIRLFARDEG